MMPLFFKFDDVFLFKPVDPKGAADRPGKYTRTTRSLRQRSASPTMPAKVPGLVGVRLSANREFGPTSEPFEGTNIIGRVIDTEKLKKLKEKEKVYIREVKR